MPNCNQLAATGGSMKSQQVPKITSKVIAEARLKLDGSKVLAMRCIRGEPSCGKLPACATIESGDNWTPDTDATRANSSHFNHIIGKGHVGNFSSWPDS